jgi:hypothetical protein
MAVNISEANAVNQVLRHLRDETCPDPHECHQAAVLLAGRAYMALSAGMNSNDVKPEWFTGTEQA